MGQVATVTDAENRTTAYGYNFLGARNSLTFSDTGVQTVNTFDGAGRPLEITSPSGRKQNLTYNFLGNVTQVQFKNSGGTVTETQAMTYDDYGRETATSSSQYSASTAKTYNDRGQLATESTTYSGQTYTVTYHYDAQGRPNKLTYPSGREAEYTYDDRQLLKTIKWETTQIEDRSYNDAGMLTGVDRAYVDETRTYNAGSQLTQIDNTSVGSQTYTYDLNGNVTSETLSGVMANYSFSTLHSGSPYADGYDAEDRFMRFKRSGVSEDILLTRSDIGNISNVNRNGTNTARGYNTSHGLTTVTGGTTQTYDTDGNTTKLHTNVTAAWDDAGRMKNTDVPSGASAGIEGLNENGYVGGTRIWKKITRNGKGGPSVVEHRVHIHAGPNLIAEYNAGVAASTPVQEYVYAGEIDSLVLIRRSDATKYGVTRNRQWSITALHDLANGNVVERYAYEMTGKRTIYAANGTTVRTTSSYGNNFGYTNRWHDEDSGLMYFRARYYNPLTGEFLSRDPKEFVDGMSLFRGYFAINAIDAFGLRKREILAAIDGTGSYQWLGEPTNGAFSEWFPGSYAKTTKLGRWLSHVRNFYQEYGGDERAYWHGPSGWRYGKNQVTGWSAQSIVNGVYDWICTKFCEALRESALDADNCGHEPPYIDIIGHSRGAVIAVDAAWRLNNEGCECMYATKVRHKPVDVRFVGTYDAIDMGLSIGNNVDDFGRDIISPNVSRSAVAWALGWTPLGNMSRGSWRRVRYSNASAYFKRAGTHSAFGGAPTFDGDPGQGYNATADIITSIMVDQWMRKQARSVGVPIGTVADYDFDNLPTIPPPPPPPPRQPPIGGCFFAGTPVKCGDDFKPINELVVGDLVDSFSIETNEWERQLVNSVKSFEYNGLLVKLDFGHDLPEVACTEFHPFWVKSDNINGRLNPVNPEARQENRELAARWVQASELRVGDEVFTQSGRRVLIREIHYEIANVTVYNIVVSGNRNFAIGKDGILVHNKR